MWRREVYSKAWLVVLVWLIGSTWLPGYTWLGGVAGRGHVAGCGPVFGWRRLVGARGGWGVVPSSEHLLRRVRADGRVAKKVGVTW